MKLPGRHDPLLFYLALHQQHPCLVESRPTFNPSSRPSLLEAAREPPSTSASHSVFPSSLTMEEPSFNLPPHDPLHHHHMEKSPRIHHQAWLHSTPYLAIVNDILSHGMVIFQSIINTVIVERSCWLVILLDVGTRAHTKDFLGIAKNDCQK